MQFSLKVLTGLEILKEHLAHRGMQFAITPYMTLNSIEYVNLKSISFVLIGCVEIKILDDSVIVVSERWGTKNDPDWNATHETPIDLVDDVLNIIPSVEAVMPPLLRKWSGNQLINIGCLDHNSAVRLMRRLAKWQKVGKLCDYFLGRRVSEKLAALHDVRRHAVLAWIEENPSVRFVPYDLDLLEDCAKLPWSVELEHRYLDVRYPGWIETLLQPTKITHNHNFKLPWKPNYTQCEANLGRLTHFSNLDSSQKYPIQSFVSNLSNAIFCQTASG